MSIAKSTKVIAVITARDEAETIGEIVRQLRQCYFYDVIVVDDGSADDTGYQAKRHGATVVRHSKSQGIAASLMEAWREALNEKAEYIVQLDAGGSHDPNMAIMLLDYAARKDYDLVIGSRFFSPDCYKGRYWRYLCSRFAAAMMNFAARAELTDWTSGYRVFSRDCAQELLKHTYISKMHAWQMETLCHALIARFNVGERPISYIAGRSSLKWSVVSESIAVWLWRFFY